MRTDPADTIELPGFVLDLGRSELRDATGASVALRAQAWAVLERLARDAGALVSKEALMQAVWPDVVVTDDSLVQCIKELRRTLRDEGHHIIRTEPRRGYRLVVEATRRAQVAEPFHQDIRFAASAGGVRIAYATCGEGPVAFVRAAHWMTHLEHDWQSTVYGPWIQGMARRHRLVRYDGRGCGLSDRSVPPAALDDEVDDLEAVVDAAGLERFALIGRSQGGAISIRYAARHPDRVSHMILIGGFARGPLRRADDKSFESVTTDMLRVEAAWGRDTPAFRQLVGTLMFPGANAEQMSSLCSMQRVAATPAQAAQIQRMVSDYDASPDLPHVRCPTLVLHSPHDCVVPFEEGRLTAAGIAGARFEPFESPNHTPLPGEPAYGQVWRAVDEFVQGTRPERARAVLRSVAG